MSLFTPSQKLAIDVTDRNLIVSAGAGAGKTFTLIERVFRLLAAKESPASLDELLIVTFSRLAAQEMKTRLVARLTKALEEEALDDGLRDHLEEQLFLIPRAQISTIHSFCLEMISSFPERAGLAPGFDLMAEQEMRMFHREFLLGKIEEALAGDGPAKEALVRLLNQLDPMNGIDQLVRLVLSLFSFLDSVPDTKAFLALCREMYEPPGGNTAEMPPALSRLLNVFLREEIGRLRDELLPALEVASRGIHQKLHPQSETIAGIDNACREFLEGTLDVEGLTATLSEAKLPRLTMPKNDASEVDQKFRELRDKAGKAIKSSQGALQPFNPESLQQDLYCSTEILRAFVEEIGLKWHAELFALHMEKRRLTFAHLERLAMSLLWEEDGRPSPIAEYYRARFRYVLIDEFQDVNHLQERIVRAVARPAQKEQGGNLFVVGDVKQSIYEFRQAEPELFLDIYRSSADCESSKDVAKDARLNLSENFRSAPELLEEMNGLFARLLREQTIGIEYTDGHAFKPGRQLPGDAVHRPPRFNIRVLDKQDMADFEEEGESGEALVVAEQVEALGPPWKDICILLRSTVGSALALTEALEARGIPTYCDSRLGFLTAVEVVEVQALLQAIYNPYDDVALLGAMRGPAAEWNEEELLALRDVDRRGSLYANLCALAEEGEEAFSDKAESFRERLSRWQDQSNRLPMAEFFAELFGELHLLERAAVRPGGDQRRLNLLHLMEEARNFDSFLRKGLGEFLKFLEDMIANDEDFAPPSPLPPDADVARIMSIHKSKGMEFPVVILPFTGKRFNEMNLRQPFLFDRELGVAAKLRDDGADSETNPPLFELFRQHRFRKERAEELRLFYVALTRAKETVYLFGTVKDPFGELVKYANDPDPPLPSRVVAASNPLAWIMSHAARRFGVPPSTDEHGNGPREWEVSDGIATFRIGGALPIPPSQDEHAEEKRESPPAPELVASLEAARKRIEELARYTNPPLVRAKVSVSEFKRTFDATADGQTPPPPLPLDERPDVASLWLPPSLREEQQITGAARGTATHRFLANCDLIALSRGERKLRDEAARMVTEHFLTQEEADAVNLHDIAWFLNGDLGNRIRSQAARLERERPFTVGLGGELLGHPELQEPVVLQGVVDLLFRDDQGWVIVDFKTDFCGKGGERIPLLMNVYRPQVHLYRIMVEKALGEPVVESWLVFLGGRRNEEVPREGDTAEAFRAIVEPDAVVFAEPGRHRAAPRRV